MTSSALLLKVWNAEDARAITAELHEAGIEVSVVDLARSGLIGYGSAETGLELYVPRERLKEAQKLLHLAPLRMVSAEDEEAPRVPAREGLKRAVRWALYAFIALIGAGFIATLLAERERRAALDHPQSVHAH